MGFLDRARDYLTDSPATRRLRAAQAEAWDSAPAPSTALALRTQAGAMGPPQGPPKTPKIDYGRDQPNPPPDRYKYRGGYSDHVYQSFSAPLAFEGFGLERIRNAVAMHRLGTFLESSALMVAILGFAPVLAALQQRVAPILALARHVHGGDKGLAKLVAAEVEEMLVPRGGLMPSPYLPPQLWGRMGAELAIMNFSILQHIDGDMDPDTSVRRRYTRSWPIWAVNVTRSPRKWIAQTSEGPVEICNDGKFTLVTDEEEPHLASAICALGEESFGGKLTQEQRLSWQEFFGKPKLWATPPEKVATRSEAGNAFTYEFNEVLYGPDGRAVLPAGSKVEAVSISGEGSGAFQGSLLDSLIHIFMVLTGSSGTIGNGANQGAGPYQPVKSGAWNVLHSITARDLMTIVRGLNQGHIAPYLDQNYAEGIARAKKAGAWKSPVLSIPLPAPDRDERIASAVIRYKALAEQVVAETTAGAPPNQDRVKVLAEALEVEPFTLVDPAPKGGEIFAYHIENKIVAPDQVLDRLGLPPLPGGAGSPEQLAKERAAMVPPPPPEPPAAPVEQEAQAFADVAARYARLRIESGATAADLQKETAAMRALVAAETKP